ncbi:MAG: hypothetical protein DMF61_10055 [Blastocatellia bacterium AA13]|nr:MAG: hypothetical protein DMF61_10055 [Blastocatellia bacterium AA13]
MNIKIVLTAFVLVAAAPSVFAQQPATQAKPPAAAAKRFALINSGVLQEQIGEYKAKIDELNRRYEPQVKGLQDQADRINALETTIKSQSNVLTPARVAEMTEQLAQMKREYQRKAEDLQAEGERTKNQALEPVKKKMGAFMQDFAAKRGIAVMIDLAAAFESNNIIWYDTRVDVTQEFVAEYNKANPSAGHTAAPAKP